MAGCVVYVFPHEPVLTEIQLYKRLWMETTFDLIEEKDVLLLD